MRRRALVVLISIAFATACGTSSEPPASAPASAPPFIGTWMYDQSASSVGGLRLVFRGDPGGEMEMTFNGIGYKFRFDGKEHEVMGMQAAWRQTGPREWEDRAG